MKLHLLLHIASHKDQCYINRGFTRRQIVTVDSLSELEAAAEELASKALPDLISDFQVNSGNIVLKRIASSQVLNAQAFSKLTDGAEVAVFVITSDIGSPPRTVTAQQHKCGTLHLPTTDGCDIELVQLNLAAASSATAAVPGGTTSTSDGITHVPWLNITAANPSAVVPASSESWPDPPTGPYHWIDARELSWDAQPCTDLDNHVRPHMFFKESEQSVGYFKHQQQDQQQAGQAAVLCVHVAGSLHSESLKRCLGPPHNTVLVLGYFFSATLAQLGALLVGGPEELWSRHSRQRGREHLQRWKLTCQDLDPQGVPVWEVNVRSEVDLKQLQPRFEYMTQPSPSSCSSDGSSSSSRENSPALAQDAGNLDSWNAQPYPQHISYCVVIKHAGEKGLGLFAEQVIPKGGRFIGPYGGHVTAEDPEDHLARRSFYTFTISSNAAVKRRMLEPAVQCNQQQQQLGTDSGAGSSQASAMASSSTPSGSSSRTEHSKRAAKPSASRSHRNKAAGSGGQEQYMVDAEVYGNALRFVNHSCQPNCSAVTLENADGDGEAGTIMFESGEADIMPGEELTIDYTSGEKVCQLPKGHRWLQPCHCGSGTCCKGYVFPVSVPLDE